MEQYIQVIVLAGLFVGTTIGGIITALMRTSALSANQKTNQFNISELQKKLEKTTLAAARMYGKLEVYEKQVTFLQGEIKVLEGHKNDLARLLLVEREKWTQDKAKYEGQINLLRSRINHLESELKKYQPLGAVA